LGLFLKVKSFTEQDANIITKTYFCKSKIYENRKITKNFYLSFYFAVFALASVRGMSCNERLSAGDANFHSPFSLTNFVFVQTPKLPPFISATAVSPSIFSLRISRFSSTGDSLSSKIASRDGIFRFSFRPASILSPIARGIFSRPLRLFSAKPNNNSARRARSVGRVVAHCRFRRFICRQRIVGLPETVFAALFAEFAVVELTGAFEVQALKKSAKTKIMVKNIN
jgi:hypothetical protein